MQRIICFLVLMSATLAVSGQHGTELPGQEREEAKQAKYRGPDSKFKDLQNRVKNEPNFIAKDLKVRQKKFIDELKRPTQTESANVPYADQPGIGIFSLLPETSCQRTIGGGDLASLYGTNCLDQTLPGKGRQFSFRKETYVAGGWDDLSISKDFFISRGNATHTLLADLGDVPLFEVGLTDPKLSYLMDFVPAKTVEEFEKQASILKEGLNYRDLSFSDKAIAVEGHTYALRSIAYAGKLQAVYAS
jgi:hypothetical protein